MKGFTAIVLIGTFALVSSIAEKSEKVPSHQYQHQPEPSSYSLFAKPLSSQNGYASSHTHSEVPNGHLMPKPVSLLTAFKKELLPQMIFVSIIGAGLWIIGALIKSFLMNKLHHFLPLISHDRRRRDVHSHVDDITATILAAISSQECMERAACEFGNHSKSLQITKAVLPILDKMSSKSVIQAFENGLTGKYSCEKYNCKIHSS